ncbi:Lrp/AsnC family transcriptional regulator [bacterium]|nr:Lrp/AsnC family transcriptional regulator [bacterium]
MKLIPKKDLLILSELRKNARETLTRMSRRINIPTSTIFDKIKQYNGNLIKSYTTLINFSELGFNTRANIMLRFNGDVRNEVKEYLLKHPHVNSVSKIGNGFDFMFEAIFVNIKDMEEFIEKLDEKFKIENKEVYYIVEDIKKEGFLCNSYFIDVMRR